MLSISAEVMAWAFTLIIGLTLLGAVATTIRRRR
jgi:hypothetical protein